MRMGGPFSSLRRAVYWTKSIPVLYIPFKSTHEQNGIFLLGKKFSILRFSFECLLQFIAHSMYVVLMQDHYVIGQLSAAAPRFISSAELQRK